jgi:hypothetical protein
MNKHKEQDQLAYIWSTIAYNVFFCLFGMHKLVLCSKGRGLEFQHLAMLWCTMDKSEVNRVVWLKVHITSFFEAFLFIYDVHKLFCFTFVKFFCFHFVLHFRFWIWICEKRPSWTSCLCIDGFLLPTFVKTLVKLFFSNFT